MQKDAATARQIVAVLVNNGIEAGGWTQNAMVTKWALQQGIEGSVLDEALIAAGELHWIEDGPQPGTITLTPLGFKNGAPL